MGTHVWEFRLSIQVCVWVLTFSIHIQLVRFRYSDSGIQVWNSDLGIQDWVYRLVSIKHSHSVFTFRVVMFMHSHSGIQVWVYRLGYAGKSVHPNLNCKPEYPECEY